MKKTEPVMLSKDFGRISRRAFELKDGKIIIHYQRLKGGKE